MVASKFEKWINFPDTFALANCRDCEVRREVGHWVEFYLGVTNINRELYNGVVGWR